MPEITEKTKIGGVGAGYDYGTSRAAHSPVTLDDLRALERTVGWTAQDAEALKMVVRRSRRQTR